MTATNSLSEPSAWRRIGTVFWRWLVLSQFAIWIGGFTFYAAYVVPVGNDVLGSVRDQGFITQQVTHWLNLVCAIAIGLIVVDDLLHLTGWNFQRRSSTASRFSIATRAAVGCTISMIGMLIWLILLHQEMDAMLDASQHSVNDPALFYRLHRWYLWISTIQWSLAWIWLAFFLHRKH